jgi:hypothetical protein
MAYFADTTTSVSVFHDGVVAENAGWMLHPCGAFDEKCSSQMYVACACEYSSVHKTNMQDNKCLANVFVFMTPMFISCGNL